MRLPYPHSMVKIQAVYPAFRRWASWLGHFIGYSFGISRKKASTVYMGRVVMLHATIEIIENNLLCFKNN